MENLLEKNRTLFLVGNDVIHEDGSPGNVTSYAYLNGPIIRAIWARSIVPTVMKTIPLKQPTYTMTFDVPIFIDEGMETVLPWALVDNAEPLIALRRLRPQKIENRINEDGSINLIDKLTMGNLLSESIYGEGLTVSPHDGRNVDRNINIFELRYKDKDGNERTVDHTIHAVEDHGNYAGNLTFKFDMPLNGKQEYFVCFINLNTGDYRAMATTDSFISFKFNAYLSSEDNRTPVEIQTRQRDVDIRIGNGQHVMITTQLELLQDFPTSHGGADYVAWMIDLASEIYGGNMNLEMLKFFDECMSFPNNIIPKEVLRGMNIKDAAFDLRMAYGESPNAYINEQLKKCVMFHINKMRTTTRLEDGYWSMIGHLNNLMQIQDFKYNVTSQSEGGGDGEDQDTEYLGFKVGYKFGFISNVGPSGKVNCISTPEIGMDKGMVTFFTSTDDQRPTYIFHVYSYTVTRGGYQLPNNPYIPAIMITKRHQFNEFVSSQIRFRLIGNDESQWLQPTGIITPTKSV
jgi:hypothetical protein